MRDRLPPLPHRAATLAACSVIAVLALAGCGSDEDPAAPRGTDRPAESTPAPPRSYSHYVALGDSYTAAPGVPVQAPGPCAQSSSNYPKKLAAALGITVDDRSCSSADLGDLVAPQGPGVEPQLSAVTPETDLVTMRIGANPTAYGALVFGCAAHRAADPQGAPCRAAMRTGSGADRIISAIVAQRGQLTTAVEQIQATAPDARLILVGYPAVFPSSGSCPERLPLAAGDVAYADTVLRAVNDELKEVAEATGAEYLDTYERTAGHDMCSTDPWIQGRENAPGVALFYHPRLEEQQAVTDLLLDRLL